MALLQISEPGLSTAPHQHRLAVGIDLGTTNSLVATVRNGFSVVLNDADGRSLLVQPPLAWLPVSAVGAALTERSLPEELSP